MVKAPTNDGSEFLHRAGQIDQLACLRAQVPQERVALVYAHPKTNHAVRFRGAKRPSLTSFPGRSAVPDHRRGRVVADGYLVPELPLLQELSHLVRRQRAAGVEARPVDAGAVHDEEPGGVGAALGNRGAQGGGAVVVLGVDVEAVLEELAQRVDVAAARGEAEEVTGGVRDGRAREVVEDVEGLVVPRRDRVPQRRVALRVCTPLITDGNVSGVSVRLGCVCAGVEWSLVSD